MTTGDARRKAAPEQKVTRFRFSRPARVGLFLALCFCGAHRASAQVFADDKDSCQHFVQNFYDWYWNSLADEADMPGLRAHSLADVLKRKPPVLAPELLKLFKKARLNGTLSDLGFDPFLNTNSPQGKYTVSKVEISGQYCRATIDAGHEVAALKMAGASWVFVDFHYSYYYSDGTKRNMPDTDLITLLTS